MDPTYAPSLGVCRLHQHRGVFATTEQASPEQMVIFVESGSMVGVFNGTETVMNSGAAVWLASGSTRSFHNVAGAPSARHYNLRLSLTHENMPCLFTRAPLILVRNAWGIHAALQQLHDLYHHSNPFHEERLRALLALLFVAFFTAQKRAPSSRRELSASQRIRLDTFIVKHMGDEVSPAALAAHMNLSLEYFSRLFRTTYGLAPRSYLKHERMRHAGIRLLESALSVKEIAAECGILNMSLFCRQFRAVHGCTPGEYRERGEEGLET